MKAFQFTQVEAYKNYIQENSHLGHLVFSSTENIVRMAQFSTDGTVLCSTSGEYTPKGYANGVITGFSYEVDIAEVVVVDSPPIKSLNQLKAAYSKVASNKEAFALLLCDGLSQSEESFITTFYFTKNDFKIIGGSAGDDLKFTQTEIYVGNKKVKNVAMFFNMKRKTHLVKENIFLPSGKKMLVTESDPINRTVKTFNNKPASQEYARMLNIPEGKLSAEFINHPLGKLYDSEIYIASPMKVNPDKSITFYCQVMPNTFVEILNPAQPTEILKETLSSLPKSPSFVLAINCILRSLKFQEDGLWNTFDQQLIKYCANTTGFISYGEQFYRQHLNQTMVMLIIE